MLKQFLNGRNSFISGQTEREQIVFRSGCAWTNYIKKKIA